MTTLTTAPFKFDEKVTLTNGAASSSVNDNSSPDNLIDDNPYTYWVSGFEAPDVHAWVSFDMGEPRQLSRLLMDGGWSNSVIYFPQDFEIQVSVDRQNWLTVHSEVGMRTTIDEEHVWQLGGVTARFVRIYVTQKGPGDKSDIYAAAGMARMEVFAYTGDAEVDLSWVAPGDDSFVGQAVAYDVRIGTGGLNEDNFANATPIDCGAPLSAGTLEHCRVTNLATETSHEIGLKAQDRAGNWSDLSNTVEVITPGMPPAPILDLTLTGVAQNWVDVKWTATGDDGNTGTAAAYEIRFSPTPINESNWDQALTATTQPSTVAPEPAGTVQSARLTGLAPNTPYFVAIKVVDEIQQRSVLSNILPFETADGTAPGRIGDLSVAALDPSDTPPLSTTAVASSGCFSPETCEENLLDDHPATGWFSPRRDVSSTENVTLDPTTGADSPVNLSKIRLRAANGFEDMFPRDFQLQVKETSAGDWKTIVQETNFVTGGGWEEWVIGGQTAHRFRVLVDATGAWGGKHYAAIGDIALFDDSAALTSVRLTWSATGDDGTSGTASAYDLRRAGGTVTEDTFAQCHARAWASAPSCGSSRAL